MVKFIIRSAYYVCELSLSEILQVRWCYKYQHHIDFIRATIYYVVHQLKYKNVYFDDMNSSDNNQK